MSWKRKAATLAVTIGVLGGGLAAGAAPAQALGGCAANALCIWDQNGNEIVSTSTNSCFRPEAVSSSWTMSSYVYSYVNNLSVNAYVWDHYEPGQWTKDRTLVGGGGYSSNIGIDGLGANYGAVCDASQNPLSYGWA